MSYDDPQMKHLESLAEQEQNMLKPSTTKDSVTISRAAHDAFIIQILRAQLDALNGLFEMQIQHLKSRVSSLERNAVERDHAPPAPRVNPYSDD